MLPNLTKFFTAKKLSGSPSTKSDDKSSGTVPVLEVWTGINVDTVALTQWNENLRMVSDIWRNWLVLKCQIPVDIENDPGTSSARNWNNQWSSGKAQHVWHENWRSWFGSVTQNCNDQSNLSFHPLPVPHYPLFRSSHQSGVCGETYSGTD